MCSKSNEGYEEIINAHPVTYDDSVNKWTANSNDASLIGKTKCVKVEVEFATWPVASYPTVSTTEQTGPISFLNPCDQELSTITAVESDDFTPDVDFTGEIATTIKDFTVFPDICEVEYECTSVVRKLD